MKLVPVIPVGAGRRENLRECLASLALQAPVSDVVVVFDGPEAVCVLPDWSRGQLLEVELIKHEPGFEQPRNVGTRIASEELDATHVWFVDSDIVLSEEAGDHLLLQARRSKHAILVGPYEWLGQGQRPASPGLVKPGWDALTNDPRWPSFHEHPAGNIVSGDLAAGLACFSGNLVWPVSEFERVGGFWNQLHHGRCEDGELGLRAVAMGCHIGFVAAARGYHLWHPVNHELALTRNARDVPMLNERHPWVEGSDVFMVERDGRAFDAICGCGESVPTIQWWRHAVACPQQPSTAIASHAHGG